MSGTIDLLYVGSRHRADLTDVVDRGAVVLDAPSVYDGIARLKRDTVAAALIEFAELGSTGAIEALREAAGSRPLLISMSEEEWAEARALGTFDSDEVLVRPFYPEELWKRVTRVALPPATKAVRNFRRDADRLGALIHDIQRLNRFTNDIGAFGDTFVAIVKARLRAQRVTLFARGAEPGELTIIEAAGLDAKVVEQAILRLGEGVAGELAQQRRVVHVKEAGRDGPTSGRDYRRNEYLIVPLVHDDEIVGVVCATERFDEGTFRESDVAYMEAFGEMAAQSVANALQYRTADELATIDEGTQLYNRRHFNRVLPQEVQRAKRYKHDLTLALIDIDHFKLYNDSNGHQEGDRALAIVAKVLKESFRSTDVVVRYGGEEFAVIMPETNRKKGNDVQFVDRARQSVEEQGLTFEDQSGNTRVLTVSGGIATLPLQADDWKELFEKADQALYRAKARGRNNIVGS